MSSSTLLLRHKVIATIWSWDIVLLSARCSSEKAIQKKLVYIYPALLWEGRNRIIKRRSIGDRVRNPKYKHVLLSHMTFEFDFEIVSTCCNIVILDDKFLIVHTYLLQS